MSALRFIHGKNQMKAPVWHRVVYGAIVLGLAVVTVLVALAELA